MSIRVITRAAVSAIIALAAASHVENASALGTVPTGFTEEAVLDGLSQPAGFAFLPDGRALVTEQRTRQIKIVKYAPTASATIFTVPDVQVSGNEQGLLGIAADPRWPAKPFIYVYFDRTPGNVIYIRRYTAAGALTDPTSTAITLSSPFDIMTDIPDVASNHNGGTIHFGLDGMLYASLGDDAVSCDAQILGELQGKILRLNTAALPDSGTGPAPKSLITPADNPYVTDPSANAKLVYCLGLRNPYRFTIDSRTGELFIGDVGLNSWEEMDRGNSGDNFGWPRREGAHTGPNPGCAGSNGEDPIAEYAHGGSSYSIIGGPRYRHAAFGTGNFPAEYDGSVFFAEYYQGFIRRYVETSPGVWALAPMVPGQPSASDWATGLAAIGDMQVGPDGAIWYLKQFNAGFSGVGSLRRIRGTPSASVGAGSLPGAALAVSASPNPGRVTQGSVIDFTLPAASRVAVGIYDVGGTRIATVFEGMRDAGSHREGWNGLDAHGRAVAPGVYFVRLETAEGTVAGKLALVR